MRISQIDTIRLGEYPNLLLVEVMTDEGLVGLGETILGAQTVEAHVHESAAPYLLGRDPLLLEQHAGVLRGTIGAGAAGAETRASSALDLALWDLAGQAAELPLSTMLGGSSRDSIRTYNSCAGYAYGKRLATLEDSWEPWTSTPLAQPPGPYEDYDALLNRPEELAESLLAEGFTALKAWPFDQVAMEGGSDWISNADLERGLEPLRRIREVAGDRIDILVELHGVFGRAAAKRIVAAVAEIDPMWIEDPLPAWDVDGLAELARGTHIPLALSETLAGRRAYQQLLDAGAVGVTICDVTWCGGLTEARKIAALAELHGIPFAPHDCTGPVSFVASTHLCLHAPNTLFQEMVRAYVTSWYEELLTALPAREGDVLRPPPGPGLGAALRPEVRQRPDAIVTTSSARAGKGGGR